MAGSKTRKCEYCKENIKIKNKENLSHILKYKNKFYHTSCFKQLAESRVAANNRYSASWQEALNNIEQLIENARVSICTKVKTDSLNDYLLVHYNICCLSSRFWSVVVDIGNGIYKHKRCKAVDCDMLLEMWVHYQNELNQIAVWNKAHGKDIDGESRVNYDLAILMSKYGEYLKYNAKQIAEETKNNENKNTTKINYNNLSLKNTSTENDDISNLLNEIF